MRIDEGGLVSGWRKDRQRPDEVTGGLNAASHWRSGVDLVPLCWKHLRWQAKSIYLWGRRLTLQVPCTWVGIPLLITQWMPKPLKPVETPSQMKFQDGLETKWMCFSDMPVYSLVFSSQTLVSHGKLCPRLWLTSGTAGVPLCLAAPRTPLTGRCFGLSLPSGSAFLHTTFKRVTWETLTQ